MHTKIYRKILLLSFVLVLLISVRPSLYSQVNHIKSTVSETLQYLNGVGSLAQSEYWPNMDPEVFYNNLKTFTVAPLHFYEGSSTNFCAYSALTYLPLQYDPLGFAKFLVTLYKTGEAKMGSVIIKPSLPVRQNAGLLKYKGILDINHAAQMWFLSLADHFKGYLNIDKTYQPGDENRMWASTNLSKFNRMLRQLFQIKLESIGADLWHPRFTNVYTYLQKRLQKGNVFLYLNNRKLNRKSHKKNFLNFPTHYILLIDVKKLPNNDIEIKYWDYGKYTVRQLPESFLKKIIYGVTSWKFNDFY